MDYNQGFKDAVEIFEESINKAITKDKDWVTAMNEIVSTLYITKLRFETMEDDLISNLEEQHRQYQYYSETIIDVMSDEECQSCPEYEECLEDIMKEEF